MRDQNKKERLWLIKRAQNIAKDQIERLDISLDYPIKRKPCDSNCEDCNHIRC